MKKAFFFLPLFLLCLLLEVGGASFVYISGIADLGVENVVSVSASPVCYAYPTSDSSSKTYYTSLGKALDANNDQTAHTIVMIPGDSATVYTYSGAHSLGANDTLILPYDANEAYYEEIKGNSTDFADTAASTYRKIQLQMASGSVLTISSGASLYIGGQRKGQGVTSDNYCEISMASSSSIVNYGKLYCYGFTKEEVLNTAEITCESGGSIYLPMVVYDYGSATSICAKKEADVFPLNRFDFPNCRARVTAKYGSTISALFFTYGEKAGKISQTVNLYASSGDSLFLGEAGSSLSIRFGDSSSLTSTSTEDTKHTVYITAKGNIKLSHLSVSVKVLFVSYDIDSADFYLPIPGTYRIAVEDGTFTVPNKVKFMPGANVTINKTGAVVADANIVFFQSNIYTDSSGTNVTMPSSDRTFTTAATLINNGSLSLNAGFSGYCVTQRAGAKLMTGSSFKVTDDCYQASASGSSATKIGPFSFPATFDYASDAAGTGYAQKKDMSANSLYKSYASSSSKYFFSEETYSLDYKYLLDDTSLTSSDYSAVSNPSSFGGASSSSYLTVPTLNDSDSSIVFAGFYYDEACTKEVQKDATGYILSATSLSNADSDLDGKVTIYGKWTRASVYTLTFKGIYAKDDLSKYSEVEKSLTKIDGSSISLSEDLLTENEMSLSYCDVVKVNNSSNVCLYYDYKKYKLTGFKDVTDNASYSIGDTYKVTKDATLEAVYGDVTTVASLCTLEVTGDKKYSSYSVAYTVNGQSISPNSYTYDGRTYYLKGSTVSGTVKSQQQSWLFGYKYTLKTVSWSFAGGDSGSQKSNKENADDVSWSFTLSENCELTLP